MYLILCWHGFQYTSKEKVFIILLYDDKNKSSTVTVIFKAANLIFPQILALKHESLPKFLL